MKLSMIVPVASFEPLGVLEKSVRSLRGLDLDGMQAELVYVIDRAKGTDERVEFLQNLSWERIPIRVISRMDTRGKRAGAINDALATLENADYVALFDIDSRPEPNFVVETIKSLRSQEDAAIASSARYITNAETSFITRIISAEYLFFADVFRIFELADGFKQFNGLIGVIDGKVVSKLDEKAVCEDLDFMQKIYLKNKIAAFTRKTRVGEQAPTTLKELYNQRVRWMTGALEGFKAYFPRFAHANILGSRKLGWFLSLTVPFTSFIFMPVLPFYGIRMRKAKVKNISLKIIGLLIHIWLISLCGLRAILNQILKQRVEWKETSRADV
jgi:cellulose synthase/poly-beta-1,6-N-acetylglucosamine synthase-like glycosyltransferase